MAWKNSNTPMSPEFRRNAPLVLERDGRKCRLRYRGVCTSTAMAVDHRKPRFEGGTDAMSNLQAVCDPCHAKKTFFESLRARKKRREDARHPWTRVKNPGLL